jgi:pyruvate/2-oxoacid:ferredoxin oxidoreductase beta subunit/Pyruvate/2-oxoacid:ferredoxin oxidoreductase gamma subunit
VSATLAPPETYRNASPYPFCPGCGHSAILDHLNRALVKIGADPKKTVIVSDIGCSGLSDQYFTTNAFHGLHGRSIAYATGIKLARPELHVIVVMGDGGCGIGGAHLLNAARRNIGITVLVFNNFNFGMTGGQHSVTTPSGSITSTTPGGNLERPLDVCGTVAVNGAGYVWRGTSFDADLSDRIAEGIVSGGFALLDVWELCTAYFVPSNDFSRKDLLETLSALNLPTGLLARAPRPEYAAAYRAAAAETRMPPGPRAIAPRFTSRLSRPFSIVVAGAAGGKVRSAVKLAGAAGLLSGLYAAQRDDYPVTVKTGHSISELVLSPTPIDDTTVGVPDALVLLATESRKKVARALAAMTEEGRVFVTPEHADVETRAKKIVLTSDLSKVPRSNRALAHLASALADLALFPREALEEAGRSESPRYADANLAAIAAGLA